MMHLELTEEEHFTLTHILENYLSDLRMEIVDTDSSEFKDMLRDRKAYVTRVLEKLQQIAPATPPEAQAMKLFYYEDTDSLYIDLAEWPGADSREVAPGVVLDFDAEGRLVGIDIEHASENVELSRLEAQALPVASGAFSKD